MIFFRRQGQLIVTTQTDHAFFSGQLASLWRDDDLPANPRREEILFAAREHDNGWREADAAPRVDPATHRPHSFMSIPDDLRFDIWKRGIERFAEEHPYASLLIAHHALDLHEDHRGEATWEEFFAALDPRHQELRERSGADAITLRLDYRFIELTDLLSLAIASGWSERFERSGLAFQTAGSEELLSEIEVDPLPFAGATTFQWRYRVIEDRDYTSDSDLAITLAEAHWRQRPVRLRSP